MQLIALSRNIQLWQALSKFVKLYTNRNANKNQGGKWFLAPSQYVDSSSDLLFFRIGCYIQKACIPSYLRLGFQLVALLDYLAVCLVSVAGS